MYNNIVHNIQNNTYVIEFKKMTHESDCTETMIRNMVNLFLFDCDENNYDSIPNNLTKFKDFIATFYNYVIYQNMNDINVHWKWIECLNENIRDVIDNKYTSLLYVRPPKKNDKLTCIMASFVNVVFILECFLNDSNVNDIAEKYFDVTDVLFAQKQLEIMAKSFGYDIVVNNEGKSIKYISFQKDNKKMSFKISHNFHASVNTSASLNIISSMTPNVHKLLDKLSFNNIVNFIDQRFDPIQKYTNYHNLINYRILLCTNINMSDWRHRLSLTQIGYNNDDFTNYYKDMVLFLKNKEKNIDDKHVEILDYIYGIVIKYFCPSLNDFIDGKLPVDLFFDLIKLDVCSLYKSTHKLIYTNHCEKLYNNGLSYIALWKNIFANNDITQNAIKNMMLKVDYSSIIYSSFFDDFHSYQTVAQMIISLHGCSSETSLLIRLYNIKIYKTNHSLISIKNDPYVKYISMDNPSLISIIEKYYDYDINVIQDAINKNLIKEYGYDIQDRIDFIKNIFKQMSYNDDVCPYSSTSDKKLADSLKEPSHTNLKHLINFSIYMLGLDIYCFNNYYDKFIYNPLFTIFNVYVPFNNDSLIGLNDKIYQFGDLFSEILLYIQSSDTIDNAMSNINKFSMINNGYCHYMYICLLYSLVFLHTTYQPIHIRMASRLPNTFKYIKEILSKDIIIDHKDIIQQFILMLFTKFCPPIEFTNSVIAIFSHYFVDFKQSSLELIAKHITESNTNDTKHLKITRDYWIFFCYVNNYVHKKEIINGGKYNSFHTKYLKYKKKYTSIKKLINNI